MGRTVFEIKTPMPTGTSRQAVLTILRDHEAMIRLNPLTYDPKTIEPPPLTSTEELDFQWYEIKDRIEYLPKGLWSSTIVYRACFRDREDSLETHTYAPMGIKTVSKWTVPETSTDETRTQDGAEGGTYLREEVEMTCNFLLLAFVKRTMVDAHKEMARILGEKLQEMLASQESQTTNSGRAEND